MAVLNDVSCSIADMVAINIVNYLYHRNKKVHFCYILERIDISGLKDMITIGCMYLEFYF